MPSVFVVRTWPTGLLFEDVCEGRVSTGVLGSSDPRPVGVGVGEAEAGSLLSILVTGAPTLLGAERLTSTQCLDN